MLVADAHRVYGEAVALRLRECLPGRSVHVAPSTASALGRLDESPADVVVSLGSEVGGMADLPGSVTTDGSPAFIVVSSSRDPLEVMEAFRLGVRAWVDADGTSADLLEAIAWVERGELYVSPGTASSLLQRWLQSGLPSRLEHRFGDALSPRQVEVLRCLLAGMSTQETAEHLWLSIHTVRSHLQRMRRQFDMSSTVELVSKARAEGIPPLDQNVRRLPRERRAAMTGRAAREGGAIGPVEPSQRRLRLTLPAGGGSTATRAQEPVERHA